MNSDVSTQNPHVVIIGAGFGGLYCAKQLIKKSIRVTLIDRRNFHLFQPLLYQVASGSLSSGDIATPIRTEFADKESITVLQSEVIALNCTSRQIQLKTGETVPYDFLVVATGSHHHYFGNDQWEQHAPGLKTLEDALELRSRILKAFEDAENSAAENPDIESRITFIVVGGGPTGVELAGTIGELAHSTMRGEFRRINPAKTRVILVENDDRVLPVFHPDLSAKAARFLTDLGVELKLKNRVTDVTADYVELDCNGVTERINCKTVLWAAGNKASSLGAIVAAEVEGETDRGGRVMVNENLHPGNSDSVYVIGDLANCTGPNSKPLPGVAPVAMQQGKYVAESILRSIKGQPARPFRYFNKGSLAVVGRNRAVAEVGKIRTAGFIAWLMWAFIHIAYLVEFQNRVVVIFRWALNYMTRKRGARLITGEGMEHPAEAEPTGNHPTS